MKVFSAELRYFGRSSNSINEKMFLKNRRKESIKEVGVGVSLPFYQKHGGKGA